MSNYLFTPAVPSLPIEGSQQQFPIHRVYCVGRNYADHAREMGHDPDREPPFFFNKHPDSLISGGQDFPYPTATSDVHHEIELVVALKSGGTNIPVDEAMQHVFGYAVGLDMTRRDIQAIAKSKGHPWSTAKAFDHAAPCTALVPASKIGHPQKGQIHLDINGVRKQTGDLSSMIWSIPETIAHLSRLFELKAGDVIFTGTPSGVGPVSRGDFLEGEVEGVAKLKLRVV
ncbi:MAG: fumarylacetoacetate hydrolase family protein [Limnobacter sp.]|nr:fumarylacetoacetate hydrolase family protein [Limnobacter sp.]